MRLISYRADGRDRFGVVSNGGVIDMSDRLGPDVRTLRDAIAATAIDASTGHISFNGLGEVRKDVQVQIVKDGNWRHYAVISDPALLAPPEK